MMKANNAKVQKKAANKVVKKELEKSLTEKFLEVVKSLGHDAEHIAGDLSKASKTIAKKLSRTFLETKDGVVERDETAKTAKIPKAIKKVQKTLTKVKNTKPILHSVKVKEIASEAIAASVMKAPDAPAVSVTKAKAGSVAKKATVKPVKKTAAKATAAVPAKTSEGPLPEDKDLEVKPIVKKAAVGRVRKANDVGKS